MPGRNAAQRVLTLIARADGVPNSVSMLDGLKLVFAYEPVDAVREHARRLEACLGQLDLVRNELARLGFPPTLYAQWLDQIANGLSPTGLNQSFESLKQRLTESVRLCLAWCAYAMPDERGTDEGEAAEELARKIRELLASDALHRLPESVRQLLLSNLQAVLDALGLANIDGSQSLRKAAKAAVVDITGHLDEIDDLERTGTEATKNFVQAAGDVLGKAFDMAKKAGDAADGLNKVVKIVEAHGAKATALLGWATNLLP